MIDQYALVYLSKRDELIKRSVPEIDFVEEILSLKPGMEILDMGCGEGRHSIELARRGYKVTGVDISPILIKAAKSRAEELQLDIDFRIADVRHFVEPERYDAVLLMFVVLGDSGDEKDDIMILKNAYISLKPGGYLLASFMNAIRQIVRKNKKFNIETSTINWSADIEFDRLIHHFTHPVRLYTPSEAALMLKCCNFEVVKVLGNPFGGEKPVEKPVEPEDIEFVIIGQKPDVK